MALFVCPAPAVIYKRVPGMIRFKFGVFCFNLPPLCYLISRQRNLFVFAPFFLLISCLCVESVIEAAVSLLQCLHLCSDCLMKQHGGLSPGLMLGHYPLSRVETLLQPVPALHMALPYKLNVYPPSHAFTSQPRTLV